MSVIIAGERSGVGKTTITLALLASLKSKNLRVQSFKVGPDYIDPMFHQYVTGRPCRNLDPILTSEAYVKACFSRHAQGVECALIEGVMGLFDGVGIENEFFLPSGSTAHVARLLDLPVLLVIDCSRLSHSVAAIAHGYRSFDPKLKLAGVVLNRVGSDRHLELLQDALEPLQLPILGIFRRQDNITIPDRHLGLVPTGELPQLDAVIDRLTELGNTCFDWEKLLPLLPPSCFRSEFSPISPSSSAVKIAIARDAAFNFYYRDNLDILQQLGANLVFWSPLTDSTLPEGVQGLYFGGGFPEIFASQLAENTLIRNAVRTAILAGMPTYAECGGLMYLCQEIIDFEQKAYSMVGILPTTAVMGKKLSLGYRNAITLENSPILTQGTSVCGHEFHRSELTVTPDRPLFKLNSLNSKVALPKSEGWQLYQLHASYLHLHWGENLVIPTQFIQTCILH